MNKNLVFKSFYCESPSEVTTKLDGLYKKYGDKLVDWNVSSTQSYNNEIRHYLWVAINQINEDNIEQIKIN